MSAQAVNLLTNQWRLRLSSQLQVYQYEVVVHPDNMSDAFIMQGIFKVIRRKVDAILGVWCTSGRSVYTTSDIDDSLMIEADFRGIKYQVVINAESKRLISGKNLTTFKGEDNAMIHTLLNIIVKQAFRETNLR